MYPLLFGSNPFVLYEVERFRRLIASKGGSLGDETISESEALSRLSAFVTILYAHAGRRDFWPFQTAYQAAVDIKCWSFHGLEGTLVNGPEWDPSGLVFSDASQAIEVPGSLVTSAVNTLGIVAFKRTDFSGRGRIMSIQGGSFSTWNPIFQGNSFGGETLNVANICGGSATLHAPMAKDEDFHTVGYCYDGSSLSLAKDGAVIGSVTGTVGSTPPTHIDDSRFFTDFIGTGSFALVGSGVILSSRLTAIQNAYEATLGKDL